MHSTRFVELAIIAAAAVGASPIEAAPTSYGTYYDDYSVSVSTCLSSAGCRVNFSQLPSDKLTLVRKVNCKIRSTEQVFVARLSVSAANGGVSLGRFADLPTPAANLINTFYYMSIDTDPQWLIGQSRFPYVEVQTIGLSDTTMVCNFVGELVTPIQ
ncbi:hypothetical protein JQ594_16200 [Bradyrhizobium manausense]|uniref:hypothetical protein n=1 Tax=Bradyrhizobium manausense TaxID=989370 RepID=UPI001BAC8595|nr:hypothetical protein [Bradyrhizobium manausense]MBR0687474.1 hypothetical protein [Bradyrhizobium manausense]